LLIGHKGEKGDSPGSFNRQGQSPLVFGAGSGNPAGQDFSPFGNKAAEGIRVLIVYLQLLDAEFANLLLKINLSFTPAAFTFPAIQSGIRSPVLPGRALA
jgi:hypothetical protein